MDVDDDPAAGEAWTFPRYGSGASSGRAPRVIDDVGDFDGDDKHCYYCSTSSISYHHYYWYR